MGLGESRVEMGRVLCSGWGELSNKEAKIRCYSVSVCVYTLCQESTMALRVRDTVVFSVLSQPIIISRRSLGDFLLQDCRGLQSTKRTPQYTKIASRSCNYYPSLSLQQGGRHYELPVVQQLALR